jgi:hypothetical protein
VTVQQFKVFRAIGLAFKAWFANFIPITLLAAVLYAPAIIWSIKMPVDDGPISEQGMNQFIHIGWLVTATSALVAPFLTYRVVQYMNGTSSSMMSSIKHGFRGILPVIIFAVVINLLGFIPFGGIVAIFVQCYWFVCGPAAVAERLGPVAALGRSSTLTQGRRGGIFGLCFLLGIAMVIVLFALFIPMIEHGGRGGEFKHAVIILIPLICGYQLFLGIVQAVSYSLLRQDKDGVSTEELAKVFE